MMEVYRFKKLDRWDKFTIPHLHFPSRVSSARIGDLLRPRHETVDRSKHSFADLQPITIHFGGNISRRSVKDGRNYTMALKWVRPSDLVLSKIDLKNGAVGILPADWPNAVVTTHFAVYEPNTTRVYPLYLRYLVQTGEFKRWLWANRSGADGRTEVKLPVFEDLEIPLPDLAEQQAIVAAFDAARKDAAEKEQAADACETKAMADFEAALGFAPPVPLPDKPVFIASFRDLDRWSHEGALRGVLKLTDPVPAFSMSPLGTVGKVSYGLQKYPGNRPGLHARPYLRVANVQRNRLDLKIIKTINVLSEDMPKYRLEDGDLLLCEGNSAELVGRGAIWRNEIADCVHQNHVLRVRLDQSKTTPEFALSVINSSYGQAYFRTKAKQTTNLASINSKEVASFPLPLPPLADQKTMIAALDAGLADAARLRAEAAAARTKAWTAFEVAVYATEATTIAPAPDFANEPLAEAIA